MVDKNKIVATIGLSGFPEGMAASQKLQMMGEAAIKGGRNFWVISNSFVKKKSLNTDLKRIGHIEGILYLTTSPYVFSPESKIKKLKGKLFGALNEFLLVNKLINKKRLEAVIIYSSNFLYTFLFASYLRLRRRKCFLVYFELRSKIEQRKSIKLRLNDYFMDRYSFHFVNGVITISDYLIKQIEKYAPQKPYLNIPPIVKFDEYDNRGLLNNSKEKYYLFCGNIGYIEIIEFLLKSFKKVSTIYPEFLLYLVVNGNAQRFEQLRKLVENLNLVNNVNIYSGLSKEELIQKYLNAFALLIPLRNNLQDTARFPHKIAEYCASGRPFVSCKVGEVNKYFDENSAFLAENYSVDEYSQEMIKVIENPIEREERAQKAYEIGHKNFDYKSYSEPLIKFIENPKLYFQDL